MVSFLLCSAFKSTLAQYFCYDPDSGYWSCISAFPSKIIRHIMEMIRTYIIKLQSQNLIHNNRLLSVPKISYEMIPIQDQFFISWTGIGVVCRNIGPLFLKNLYQNRTHFSIHAYNSFRSLALVFFGVFSRENWGYNDKAKLPMLMLSCWEKKPLLTTAVASIENEKIFLIGYLDVTLLYFTGNTFPFCTFQEISLYSLEILQFRSKTFSVYHTFTV